MLMSAEMSSVKSVPSSCAPSGFDHEISFGPALTDRGRIDEGFYTSLSALPTILLSKDQTKPLVAQLCILDIPLCLKQADSESVEVNITHPEHRCLLSTSQVTADS